MLRPDSIVVRWSQGQGLDLGFSVLSWQSRGLKTSSSYCPRSADRKIKLPISIGFLRSSLKKLEFQIAAESAAAIACDRAVQLNN